MKNLGSNPTPKRRSRHKFIDFESLEKFYFKRENFEIALLISKKNILLNKMPLVNLLAARKESLSSL